MFTDIRKRTFLMVLSAIIVSVTIFATGCKVEINIDKDKDEIVENIDSEADEGKEENNNEIPYVTYPPGVDYRMEITGPNSIKKGETVEYFVKVTQCNFKEGLIGLDFEIEYDKNLLEYKSYEKMKVPAEAWEVLARVEERNGKKQLIFASFDDNDDFDACVAVTGPDQYAVKVTFKVLRDSSSGNEILTLYDVMGAKNNDSLDVVTGSGNSISHKDSII